MTDEICRALIWRCVLAKIATLQEIETHWSIVDLFDALDALIKNDELIDREMKKAR